MLLFRTMCVRFISLFAFFTLGSSFKTSAALAQENGNQRFCEIKALNTDSPSGVKRFNDHFEELVARNSPCVGLQSAELVDFMHKSFQTGNQDIYETYFKDLNRRYGSALKKERATGTRCEVETPGSCASRALQQMATISNNVWYEQFNRKADIDNFVDTLKDAAIKGGGVAVPAAIAALAYPKTRGKTKSALKGFGKKLLKKGRKIMRPRVLGRISGTTTGGTVAVFTSESSKEYALKDFPPPIQYFLENGLEDEGQDPILEEDFKELLMEIAPGTLGGMAAYAMVDSAIPLTGAAAAHAQAQGWKSAASRTLIGASNSKVVTSPLTKTTIWGLAMVAAGKGAGAAQSYFDKKRNREKIAELTSEKHSLERQIRSVPPTSLEANLLATRYARVIQKLSLIKVVPTIGILEDAMTQYYSSSVCDPLLAADSGLGSDSAFKNFHKTAQKAFEQKRDLAYKQEGLQEGLQISKDGIDFLKKHLPEKTFLSTSSRIQTYYRYFTKFKDRNAFSNEVLSQAKALLQESTQKSTTLDDLHKRYATAQRLRQADLPKAESRKWAEAINFYNNTKKEIEIGGFPFQCSYSQFPKWFSSSQGQQGVTPTEPEIPKNCCSSTR